MLFETADCHSWRVLLGQSVFVRCVVFVLRQTDRQSDRHTDRQTDTQTDTQTDRHTDRQTDRKVSLLHRSAIIDLNKMNSLFSQTWRRCILAAGPVTTVKCSK